jgi:hypothetical protein
MIDQSMPQHPHGKVSLTYRRDIDGLRAVAVLLVVFNHLRTRFDGGYIGVDVFFVISGFLISSVIIQEMNFGTFPIAVTESGPSSVFPQPNLQKATPSRWSVPIRESSDREFGSICRM